MFGINNTNDPGVRLIVGHVSHRKAKLWGRGDAENKVMFVKATDPAGREKERALTLAPEDGYTGVVELDELAKSTDYEVQVSYGPARNTPPEERQYQVEGHFETAPAPDQSEPFTMIVGSCNFHGWGPFRNNDKAVEKVAEVAKDADLVLHLGDQVYADKNPLSYTLADYRGAYLSTWGDQGMQKVLAGHANYMVADDHEIVNGYALDGELTTFQRTLLASRGHCKPEREQYEEMASNGKQAFAEFQSSHNPKTHGANANYYSFERGQHRFFALDTRFERHNKEGRLITQKQREALFDWLLENKEEPKFIMTAAPFVTEIEGDENWANPAFTEERERIIDFLAEQQIDNVVFLAGDIHGSGHSQMKITTQSGRELMIHELVSSPINASIMLKRSSFRQQTNRVTAKGTKYETRLDPESSVGRGHLPTIANSNVLKVEVDGEELKYEFHRTRRDDDGPFRQGEFRI